MAIGVIWVKDWLANHLKLGPLWTTHIWHFQPIKVRVSKKYIYILLCIYNIHVYQWKGISIWLVIDIAITVTSNLRQQKAWVSQMY